MFYTPVSQTKRPANPFLQLNEKQLFQSLREHHRQTLEMLQEWRTCVLCSNKFQLKETGSWGCRYHPGERMIGNEDRFTCCYTRNAPGDLFYDRGCTLCDHTDFDWHKVVRPVTKVPLFALEWLVPPHKDAIITNLTHATLIEFRDEDDINKLLDARYNELLEKRHVKIDRTDFFQTIKT